jgi:hypothetical protein
MSKILLNRIDAAKMFQVQNLQYSEILYLSDTVPLASGKMGRVSVSNLGHFYCLYVTGSFDTQFGAVDDGTDYLRGKLIDGSNQKQLFNDYVPLSLWLTPGRKKSLVASGAQSNSLFYPIPFEYLFSANSDIILDVKNDSDTALTYRIAFFGVRVKSRESVSGISR